MTIPYSRAAAWTDRPRHRSAVDPAVLRDHLEQLRQLLVAGNVFVLTGAGVSTASGVPDYRGPNGVRTTTAPITYQEFLASHLARQRYWARSFVGWRDLRAKAPNPVHRWVGALRTGGYACALVTQNVDGLHERAGIAPDVMLHGSLDDVMCVDCGGRESRDALDMRLAELNPAPQGGCALSADGDANVAQWQSFRVAHCLACGGDRLKPDVVFFGEAVPKCRVEVAMNLLQDASALLVLGSSLTVMSGYRFAKQAAAQGMPLAIVNEGVTRADSLADVRIDADVAQVVVALPLPESVRLPSSES